MAVSSSTQRILRAAGAMLIVAAAIPFAGVATSSAAETIDRTPTKSQQFTNDNNQAKNWVGVNGSTQCWKHDGKGRIDGGTHGKESANDATVWKMGTPPSDKIFTLLVLKAGQLDHVWHNPTPGALYGTPEDGKNSKDISHVIVCKGPKPTTPPTTTPPATTTPPTTAPPTTTPTLAKVSPVLECVETVPGQDGPSYLARFGYNNPNAVDVQIPVGASNKFTPSPQDRGQPTTFVPGRQGQPDDTGVFTVPFDGSNLVWTLNGKTSTASSSSKACPKPTTPPAPECAKTDIAVVAFDTPMLNVTVRIKESALNKGVDECWVSLNSYAADGPTWPTSGTQVFLDHDQVLLTDDAPEGELSVIEPPCFGQTDLYLGTTRFDGVDGALPRYPDVVTPTNLIKWWNGGEACETVPPTTEPPTTEPPTTEPPTTEPPTTEPPTTEPPTTEPPTTEPPTTEPPLDPLSVDLVAPQCDGDVPWLRYSMSGDAPEGTTVTITWLNPSGADVVQSGLPMSGRVLWPGAVIDAQTGAPLDWPGWSLVDGEWVEGDDFDWVRPEVQVVVTADAPISGASLRVADVASAELGEPTSIGYPPATPECAADPEVEVLETSDPANPSDPTVEPTVLGEKFSGLPKTGGNSLALQLALSLGLLVAGAALIALPNRLTPATERRH